LFGGVPETPITYLDTILPTQSSSTLFSFPKFNPSIGTLSCISFNDTVSVVVTTFARNTDTTAGHTYVFQTTISDAANGPRNSGPFNWVASISVANKQYGPVFLDKDTMPRLPGDSITFGPDTLLNKVIGAGTAPDVAPFIGSTGNVNFRADLSGGAVALVGGTNYLTGISTSSWGTFRLTYYWCPAAALANSISQFTAVKLGDYVLLQWIGENDQNNNSYEVQYSVDGIHFFTVTSINAYPTDASGAAKYQYQYKIDNATGERLYFRVKKTDASGKAGYSAVKTIVLRGPGATDFQAYPNPAVSKHITLESPGLITGNVRVAIINAIGQELYSKTFSMNGGSQISFDLPQTLKMGMYYLQVSNPARNTRQLIKLLVQE
jgi:hypothetical protein